MMAFMSKPKCCLHGVKLERAEGEVWGRSGGEDGDGMSRKSGLITPNHTPC